MLKPFFIKEAIIASFMMTAISSLTKWICLMFKFISLLTSILTVVCSCEWKLHNILQQEYMKYMLYYS